MYNPTLVGLRIPTYCPKTSGTLERCREEKHLEPHLAIFFLGGLERDSCIIELSRSKMFRAREHI